MKSYIVIGMGLFGKRIASNLYDAGNYVLAVDINKERIEEIADHVSKAVSFDAKNRELLMQMGIEKFDTAIVATTDDLATTVLIAMNLKSFQIPNIICKAKNKTDRKILESLGGITVLIPEHVAAQKLCQKLVNPNILDYFELYEEHSIIEFKLPDIWIGSSIAERNIRAKYGVNIIAIRRNNVMSVSFDPYSKLEKNDILVLLADKKNLEKFLKKSAKASKKSD